MSWRYPRRMRRRVHRFTRLWTVHRLALAPYKRANGGFHDEFHHHSVQSNAEARVRLLFEGVNHIETVVSHCTSSYEAMPNLLLRPPLPWPFLAMSRISLESAARICYALDPSIDAEQRLMRFGALIAWSESEATKAAASTRRPPDGVLKDEEDRLKHRAHTINELITGAGFLLDRRPREPVVRDPSGQYQPETSRLSLVDILEEQFPSVGSEYYRRSSGFVHGAPWVLQSMVSGASGPIRVPDVTRLQVVDTFLLVTVAATNAMKLSASYSGIPFGKLDAGSKDLINSTMCEVDRLGARPLRRRRYGRRGGRRTQRARSVL